MFLAFPAETKQSGGHKSVGYSPTRMKEVCCASHIQQYKQFITTLEMKSQSKLMKATIKCKGSLHSMNGC